MRRLAAPASATAAVLLLLAACDGADRTSASAPEGSSSAEPAPSASEPASPARDGRSTSSAPGTSSSGPTPVRDEPLAIAVRHGDGLDTVSLRRARRIVAGRTGLKIARGTGARAKRAVVAGRADAALVPASALGPRLRALTIAGVNPLRRPDAYPLRTSGPGAQGPVVTVTVVGDIMLGRRVAEVAPPGAPAAALRPLRRRLASADITVGNLESTLSRAGPPRQGSDSFAADPEVVRGLRAAGFDVLSLANNHAGDFGDEALVQTVRSVRRGGIAPLGAGAGVRQAWQAVVEERAGVRFGFLAFNAIGETPAVAPGRPGAVSVSMPPRTGPLDRAELSRFLAAVRALDRRVDTVVVLPHWGTQYTNRPEPIQRRVARLLVSAGADVVVGGHPHWLQGAQVIGGSLVVHSLGNFVFDMDFMERTMEGALLELTFWGGDLKSADFVPYVMDRRFAPRVVRGARGEQVLGVLRETSGPAFR